MQLLKKILWPLFIVLTFTACTKPLGDTDLASEGASSPPGAFSLGVAQLLDNKLLLSWGKSSFADSYTLKYGTSAGVYSQTLQNVTSPHVLSNLQNGTTYYFQVESKNSIGVTSTAEGSKKFSLKPETFHITNLVSLNGVTTLTWSASANAETYLVKMGTASGQYNTAIFPTSATTLSFPSFPAGTNYFLLVTATSEAGSINSTNEYTYGPEAPPSATPTFTAVRTDAICKLDWLASSGAGPITYVVKKSLTDDGATPGGAAVTAYSGALLTHSLQITDLTYFWIQATSAYGQSTWNKASCTTPKVIAPVVTRVLGYQKVTLNWGAVPNAKEYKVEYGFAANSITELKGTYDPSVTSIIISPLVNGTTYHFRVTAINDVSQASGVANGAPSNTQPTLALSFTSALSFNETVKVAATIGDTVGESILSCNTSLSATTTNTNVAPVGGISFSGTAPACFVHVTPTGNAGNAVIGVTVNDGELVSNSRTLNLAIAVLPTPERIYSVRKLVAAYTGPALRVRKVSNESEADIAFLDTGLLDNTALTNHISGSSGRIVTWYDQTGNGKHATQTDISKQPEITLVTPRFNVRNTVTQYLEMPALPDANSGVAGSFSVVSQSGNATTETLLSFMNDDGTDGLKITSNMDRWGFSSGVGGVWDNTDAGVVAQTAALKVTFNFRPGNGVRNLNVSNVKFTSGTPVTYTAPTPGTKALLFAEPTLGGTTNNYSGRLTEVIIYDRDLTDTEINLLQSHGL